MQKMETQTAVLEEQLSSFREEQVSTLKRIQDAQMHLEQFMRKPQSMRPASTDQDGSGMLMESQNLKDVSINGIPDEQTAGAILGEPIFMSVTLNLDLKEVVDIDAFKLDVASDISRALQPDVRSVRVGGLRAGSIIADVQITPQAHKTGRDLHWLLVDQSKDDKSALMSGKYTSKVTAISPPRPKSDLVDNMQRMLVDFDECLLSKVDEIKRLSAELETLRLQKKEQEQELNHTISGLQCQVVEYDQAHRSAQAQINIMGDEITELFREVASVQARVSDKMDQVFVNSKMVFRSLASTETGLCLVQQALDKHQTNLQAELREKAILQDRVAHLEKELLAMHALQAHVETKLDAVNKYSAETVHKALLLSQDVERHTLAERRLKSRQTELEDFIKRLEKENEEQVEEMKARCTELEAKMQDQAKLWASQIMAADAEKAACKDEAERRCRVLEAKVEETGKRWAEQCVTQVSELEAQRDSLIRSFSELEVTLESTQKQLLAQQQESKATIIGLQEQIQTMECSHTTQVNELEQSAQTCACNYATQMEQLSSDHAVQVASLTDRCSDLEDKLQETTLKGVALAEQIVGLEAQCQHLESSAREGRQREVGWLQQLDETRNKIIDLEKVMNEAARCHEDLQLELGRKKEEVLVLEIQHAEALAQRTMQQQHERQKDEAKMQRMQSSLDECRLQRRLLTTQVDGLKEQVRDLQSEKESLNQHLGTVESNLESEQNKMKEAQTAHDALIEGLKEKNSLLEAAAEETRKRETQLVAKLEETEQEAKRSRVNERELENRVALLENAIDRQKAHACRQLEDFKCQELYIKNAIGAPTDLDLPLTVTPDEQDRTPASPSKMAEYAKVKFAADAEEIERSKKRVKELEDQMSEAEGKISSLHERNTYLQDQLSAERSKLETALEAQVQKTKELEDAMAQANLLLQERKHFLLTSESVQVQELSSMQEAIAQATHDAETVRSELDKVLEEQTGLRGSLKRATEDLEATQKEMDAMRVESENEKEALNKQHAHSLEKWAQELFQAQEQLMQALEEASMIREQLNCQLQISKELEDAKTQASGAVRLELDKVLEEQNALRLECTRASNELHKTKMEMDALQVESQKEKDDMHEQHIKSLEALHHNFETFQAKSHSDMEALQAQHAQEIEALQVESQKERDDMHEQHVQKLEALHHEFEAFRVQSGKEMEALKAEHVQDLDVSKEETRQETDAMLEQHTQKLAELQAQHAQEIEALQVESQKERDDMHEQHVQKLEALYHEFEAFRVQSGEEMEALHEQVFERSNTISVVYGFAQET